MLLFCSNLRVKRVELRCDVLGEGATVTRLVGIPRAVEVGRLLVKKCLHAQYFAHSFHQPVKATLAFLLHLLSPVAAICFCLSTRTACRSFSKTTSDVAGLGIVEKRMNSDSLSCGFSD